MTMASGSKTKKQPGAKIVANNGDEWILEFLESQHHATVQTIRVFEHAAESIKYCANVYSAEIVDKRVIKKAKMTLGAKRKTAEKGKYDQRFFGVNGGRG
jgi:hypothetical protein